MRATALLLGLGALAMSAVVPSPAGAAPASIVRVEIADVSEVHALQQLGLDILTERPGPGWIAVRVPGDAAPLLSLTGWSTQVVVPDLDTALEDDRLRRASRPAADHTDVFFDDFRDLAEIEAHLDGLITAQPDLVTALDLGTSLEGRTIRGLQISDAPEGAPVVLINAGQHAREWIAIMAGVCVADSLVTRANEPEIEALLQQVTFIVVPVVNPDGFVFSWDDERFWRKNRRDGVGVDTNRNFATGWGGVGSQNDPEAGNYRGTAPFSEPETAAIRDLVESLPDLRAHLDVHSFGQLVLRPWGHIFEPPPADDVLAPLSEALAEGMSAPFGVTYTPIPGAELYPASGNMVDWTYGEHGAMAFTLELRPDEVEQFELGFVLLPEEIEEVCLETMGAVEALATWTANSDPGSAGDSGDVPLPGTTGGSTGDDVGTSGSASTTGPLGTSSTTIPPVETATGWTGPMEDEPEPTPTEDGCGCRANRVSTPFAGLALLALFGLVRRRCRVPIRTSRR